jgi:hypothetical protein
LLRDRVRLLEAKRLVLLGAIATQGPWLASAGSQWRHQQSSHLLQGGLDIRNIKEVLGRRGYEHNHEVRGYVNNRGPLGDRGLTD